MKLNLEWLAEDNGTLCHISKLVLEGKDNISPLHALSKRDIIIIKNSGISNGVMNTNLVVAGETLAHSTFEGAGTNSAITEALLKRTKSRMVKDKINLVHLRISKEYEIGKMIVPVAKISEIQASALVGVQLEADASAITPPLPSGLASIDIFKQVYDRTKTEIQSFKKDKEIVGYIPTTEELVLIPEMVKAYLKDGVKIFAVDFSSSPLNRWLIRTVVTSIRANLKIKGQAKENSDKQYYLHVFNVASSKKSPLEVAPITDILSHSYGVDSTSGVEWGGGKLVKEKLRFFNMPDYGAYQIRVLNKEQITHDKKLLEGTVNDVYEKLRSHRIVGYKKECEKISESMTSSGVEQHILSKERAKNEVKNVLMDIREIKSRV
jgi:hypothetical protein